MSLEGQPAPSSGATMPLLNDQYEVGERLADGTFFTTYRGRDVQSGRAVAIKVLKPEFAGDEAFAARLLAESQSAVHLRHPNIAQVHAAWQERNTVVIVTEWVRGINLKDRIRRVSPFPLPVAMDILLACTEALHYAHQNGFVHGDVRPDNVMITPDGRVKVTDFGAGVSFAASTRVQLTALPQAAYYMAPERAEGRPPDTHSDIYSLGCILYEMMSGALPYDADSPLAVAAKHMHEPPPVLRRVNPAAPPAVEGIALKCMQKKGEARYESLEALLQDIRTVREAIRTEGSLDWSPMPVVESDPVPEKKKGRAPAKARREEHPETDGGPSATLLLGLGALAILMVGVAFAIVLAFTNAPNTVQVPTDLVGMRREEAEAELRRWQLRPEVRQEYSDQEPGEVFDTDPKGGVEIRQGKAVTLWVSRGAQPVNVPDVAEQTLAAARRAIRAAGLVVGRTTEEYDAVRRKGEVISQSPAAGSAVGRKSAVDLIVSRGPEPEVPVPTVPTPDDPAPATNDPGFEPSGPSTPDPNLASRDQDLNITIPSSYTGPQQVRVVVRNEDGSEQIAYEQEHQPGDKVAPTIPVFGAEKKAKIRVYLNGKKIHEEDV